MQRKVKTFNYSAMLRSAARRIWLWSPMRKEAIRNARVGSGFVECQSCETQMKENAKVKGYQVDHIIPASEPSSAIRSWDDFIGRLFCPASGLRVLCKDCHAEKTKAENQVRTKARLAKPKRTRKPRRAN